MPNGLPRKLISVNPAITASSAYASGNCVGALQTLLNANQNELLTTMLESVTVIDAGNQKAALTLLFFNGPLTGATITDKTAFQWGAGTAISSFAGKYDVAAASYETFNSVGVFSAGSINLVMRPAVRNLYMAIVTTGTPTYTANNNLTLILGFQMT